MTDEPKTSEMVEEAMIFKQYRRKQIAELADWKPGMDLTGVSISGPDHMNGSPLPGDKIARNPKNHADRWLVAGSYFADNFEPVGRPEPSGETPETDALEGEIDARAMD